MMCIHEHTKTTLTPELQHYAREDCLDCGAFIKWVTNPETIKRREENKRRVKELQKLPLSEWQKGFLSTWPDKPSPKQLAKLDEIWKEKCK